MAVAVRTIELSIHVLISAVSKTEKAIDNEEVSKTDLFLPSRTKNF